MPDDQKPKGEKKGLDKFLSNPLVLIGGGAAVLFLMLRSGGSGGGAVDTSGATASALQQALTQQQQANQQQLAAEQDAVKQALAAQNADVGAQLAAIAGQLNNQLGTVGGGNPPPAVTPPAAQPPAPADVLKNLQAEIDKLTNRLNTGGVLGGPAPDTSPNSPNALAALSWSRAIGLPFEWGLAFIQHYGRLPANTAELELWRGQIGTQTSAGGWIVGGRGVGPGT